MDSTYSETYLYLLDIARAQHNWSETIKLGTYIVERNFDDVIVLFGLSEAYYYTKQYEKVIEVNDRIISKDNSLPEAYLNKSYAYLKLDDLDRARLELDMAQQLNPLHPDVLKIQKELQILR